MGNLNSGNDFNDVLDRLTEYGIRLSEDSLDSISFYFCDHDVSTHHRDFELFEQSDGVFLVSIGGEWHETLEVLH